MQKCSEASALPIPEGHEVVACNSADNTCTVRCADTHRFYFASDSSENQNSRDTFTATCDDSGRLQVPTVEEWLADWLVGCFSGCVQW